MFDYESDPGWQYLKLTQELMMAEQAKCPDPKKNVWVPDEEEGFVVAEIKSTKGDLLNLMTAGGKEVRILFLRITYRSENRNLRKIEKFLDNTEKTLKAKKKENPRRDVILLFS